MASNTRPTTHWLHELAWQVIEQRIARSDVVLVPIGATEQHGHHAPLMLDTEWAIATCEATAALTDCLIAPPMHYGWSFGHMAFAGTVGLRADTLSAAAEDIGNGLIRHGFRRIVFVNGNRMANLPPLEIAAVKLRLDTGAFIAVADCGLIARHDIAALADGPIGALDHAGESETSMMLSRRPELVDMSLAPADQPAKPVPPLRENHHAVDPRVDTGHGWYVVRAPDEYRRAVGPRDGTGGNTSQASAEKGRHMIQAIAKRLAAGIDEARTRELNITLPPIRG